MLRVVRKVPHPRYNSRTNDNDLMLLQLERPARLGPRVRPISVASSCARVGSSCLVSGWGTISSPVGEGPCIGNEGLVAGPLGLGEEGLEAWILGVGEKGLGPGPLGLWVVGLGAWTLGSVGGGARGLDPWVCGRRGPESGPLGLLEEGMGAWTPGSAGGGDGGLDPWVCGRRGWGLDPWV